MTPSALYAARLVAGVGVAIQVSQRVGVTVNHGHGFNLQEWGFWQVEDGRGGLFESSLTAGITYRIAR